MSFEIPAAAIAAAARVTRRSGARLVVNPSPVQALDADVLACAPIVVVNAGEARELTGEADAQAASEALLARGCAAVVVTLGAEGAHVASGEGEPVRVPAARAAVVDTTGAGDAFTGTLCAALAAGTALLPAVHGAADAAARCTEHAGARPRGP